MISLLIESRIIIIVLLIKVRICIKTISIKDVSLKIAAIN